MQSKGVSLQAKVSHSKVVSPVVGTVKKINFNTVGGVIRPGMDIMEIIVVCHFIFFVKIIYYLLITKTRLY